MKISKGLLFAILAMLVSTTCHAIGHKDNSSIIKGVVMRNYFFNNNADMPTSPMITTKQEFDTYFSPAAFMGKNGLPTPVNFKKQTVVAIILPSTDRDVIIDSVRLSQAGAHRLQLSYVVKEGARRSYSIQPIWLMAIGKQYRNYQIDVKSRTIKTVSESTADYRFVAYNDAGRNTTFTVDYPTGGDQTVVDSIRAYIGGRIERLQAMWMSQEQSPTRLQYPGNPDNAQAFVEYAVQTTVSQMLGALDSFSIAEGRYAIQMDIKRVDEDTTHVSYQTTGYVYLGGAHGLGFKDGITIDKRDGHRTNFVKDSPGLRRMITEQLHKTYSDIHFNDEPVPMPSAAPYLNDGKIVFVYQPYEIGPYAIGMPECSFYPYEIEKFLTEEGKRITR